jgi:peptidoglycan/LPS O-acetylase OafA/YrhL
VPGLLGALLLGLAVVAGVVRRERRWLVAAGLGSLCVAAGYVLFVPAAPYYEPLAPGTVTRMNVLAAVGFVVLVVAVVRLLVGARQWLVAAVCLSIGIGYVVKVADDQDGWQRSARIQAQVLAAIPSPARRGTTYYTFGAPIEAAPGVPAFSLPFDLKAALRLREGTHLVAAYPMARSTVIHCEPDRLYPTGGTYGPVHGAGYGEAVFVDVPSARVARIRDRAACLGWER